MAKKSEQTKEAAVTPPEQDGIVGHVASDIGTGLGHFLNQVESQWHSVRGQRETLVKNLRVIRDKANALLAEAGDVELPGIFKRGGRRKTGSAVSAKRGPGRPPNKARPVMSAEGRARIAEAQRLRWAKVRAAKRSGKA